MRMGNRILKKISAIGASALTLGMGIAPAVANNTMDVLLGGKQLQIVTASGSTVVITFVAAGTYTTSTGSSGTWTITDDQLCTVRAADNASSCGDLPSGKIFGDSWQTTNGNGVTVTASII